MSEPHVQALLVTPSGVVTLVHTGTSLDALRDVIGGGYLEGVGGSIDDTWHAYCDEEGKMRGMSVNAQATLLARSLGWPSSDVLVGPVVFLGSGPDGTETDVPGLVLDAARVLLPGWEATAAL